MSQYEDLNTTKIALAGFICTAVVFAIILATMVLFHTEMADLDRSKVIDQPDVEFSTITAEQQAQLAKYRWIDEKQKIVQIPIKQAMKIVLEELEKPSDGVKEQEKPKSEPPHTEKAETETTSQEAPLPEFPKEKEENHAP